MHAHMPVFPLNMGAERSQQYQAPAGVAASLGGYRNFLWCQNLVNPLAVVWYHFTTQLLWSSRLLMCDWWTVGECVCGLSLCAVFDRGVNCGSNNVMLVCASALTFSGPRSAQIQIVSGNILGVQVCGRHPALLLCCADEPPTWGEQRERNRSALTGEDTNRWGLRRLDAPLNAVSEAQ